MSPVTRLPVAVRRLLVRRPWIYWAMMLAASAAAAVVVADRMQRVDDARAAWGDTRAVLVATADAAPGETLSVEVRQLPVAVVPAAALDPDEGEQAPLARQHVAAGEIVTTVDVAGGGRSGPLALVPDGWLAIPIVEATPSGAATGDRVELASGGIVIAREALVVAGGDQVTLLAVPPDVAAMIPAAAEADGVTLLRKP
jgi:hypothetical protein